MKTIDVSKIDGITVDRRYRSGVPVIEGTRFPVATLLAELADSRSFWETTQEYDLPPVACKRALEGLASALNQQLASRESG